MHVCVCVDVLAFPLRGPEWLVFVYRLPHCCLLPCVLLSGGDRDEGEDSVGDLRRTESDSVLKKVGSRPQRRSPERSDAFSCCSPSTEPAS